jgi:hypothetical protein
MQSRETDSAFITAERRPMTTRSFSFFAPTLRSQDFEIVLESDANTLHRRLHNRLARASRLALALRLYYEVTLSLSLSMKLVSRVYRL